MEDRKQRILRAVTDDYILTGEPVGSRTIARKYLPGVSPATIRNEMADLEEQGYLEQPHASAGRIPSDLGYRYYVDELMEPPSTDPAEVQELREQFLTSRDMERAIRLAGRMLARESRYSSLVMRPTLQRLQLRHVRLAPLDEEHVLLLVVAEPAFVYNRILDWDGPAHPRELEQRSELLTDLLHDFAGQWTRTALESLAAVMPYSTAREQLAEALQELMQERGPDRAYVEGVSYFLEQPEFRNVEMARQVLDDLHNPEVLDRLLMHGQVEQLVVVIGQEQPVMSLRCCSVVMAPYGRGERVLGVVGVIGPRRMDYRRAVRSVQQVASALSQALESMPPTRGGSLPEDR
ncbi:MAG TPA: heat-inducible transcriptional repressor HrcA [Limnochordales bacterium]